MQNLPTTSVKYHYQEQKRTQTQLFHDKIYLSTYPSRTFDQYNCCAYLILLIKLTFISSDPEAINDWLDPPKLEYIV